MKIYQTIEQSPVGATYAAGPDTVHVYEISRYPRGSVLAGQQRRVFLDSFTGPNALQEARAAFPNARVMGGTTYRAPDLSHLPDDTDY